MPIRIAYFVNEYPRISHSFIRREILALEQQGIEIDRIALRGWDTSLADEADRRERSRTRYVLKGGPAPLLWALLKAMVVAPGRFVKALMLAVRIGWRAERPLPYHLAYLAEACFILPWLKSAGAAHVHAHFGNNSTEVVMLARALGGPSYSFTVHGQDELISGGIKDKVNRAAFVVAISSYGRSQLYLRIEPPQWSKVKVIHCGLDKAFYDVPPVPVTSAPRLVCVGRLCAEKGQLLLIEAAHLLASKHIDIELVLAGDGEMRQEVDARIAHYGLSGRIRITGWLDGEQVRNEILAARGLVLPSFTEGLPVVIMEALALCRPVLSTYVGGIPELVEPVGNGWLFPAGSIDGLASAMEECLRMSPDDLRTMGEAGKKRVVQRHSADAGAEKLVALFLASH